MRLLLLPEDNSERGVDVMCVKNVTVLTDDLSCIY